MKEVYSIKFTNHGNISIVIRQLPCAKEGFVRLYFCVEDTGIGIAQEQIKSLFQPFSQVDSSTSRRYRGSGLGLAISQRLVALMGGQLEVESELDHGSRFYFALFFPCGKIEDFIKQQNLKKSVEELRQGNWSVLLVDDDELNLFLGQKMLEGLGLIVFTAANAKEAIQIISEKLINIVLMDISMPDMDGYAATRRIRESGRKNLPIIAVTAHAIEGEMQRCLDAGMNDYLTKPYTINLLEQILIKYLHD
jgi:CheY-like chemotaxis protein